MKLAPAAGSKQLGGGEGLQVLLGGRSLAPSPHPCSPTLFCSEGLDHRAPIRSAQAHTPGLTLRPSVSPKHRKRNPSLCIGLSGPSRPAPPRWEAFWLPPPSPLRCLGPYSRGWPDFPRTHSSAPAALSSSLSPFWGALIYFLLVKQGRDRRRSCCSWRSDLRAQLSLV